MPISDTDYNGLVLDKVDEVHRTLLEKLMAIRHCLSLGTNIESVLALLVAVRTHDLFTPQFVSSPINVFTRIMWQDLSSDYAYLVESFNGVELASKKMALAMQARDAGLVALAHAINCKILHLFIISRCDLRLLKVQTYLQSLHAGELSWDLAHHKHTRQIYHSLIHQKMVELDLFHDFLKFRNDEVPFEYNWIILHRLDHATIEQNMIQRNIVFLSKYYTSISFHSLRSAMKLDTVYDIELAVLDMIFRHQLPRGTQLDQVREMLIYGQACQPIGIDADIASVGKLLGEICTKI